MIDKPTIQTYINNFRRKFTVFLKPGIGISCDVRPFEAGGAILEFKIAPQIENKDTYYPVSSSSGQALSQVTQQAFGGNLNGFNFEGTNVILEPDKLIFIKDGSLKEWDNVAAEKDVAQIVFSRNTEDSK
jgi:hypothetical protein